MSDCKEIRVSIQPSASLAAVAELEARLATLQGGCAEIWIDYGPFPALCALVNGHRAWMMYLRYAGDAGFSSRNPAYRGDPAATIHYQLANGQVDPYPASWSYPLPDVIGVLLHFARYRRVPEIVVWANDSGDGARSPNDAVEG